MNETLQFYRVSKEKEKTWRDPSIKQFFSFFQHPSRWELSFIFIRGRYEVSSFFFPNHFLSSGKAKWHPCKKVRLCSTISSFVSCLPFGRRENSMEFRFFSTVELILRNADVCGKGWFRTSKIHWIKIAIVPPNFPCNVMTPILLKNFAVKVLILDPTQQNSNWTNFKSQFS